MNRKAIFHLGQRSGFGLTPLEYASFQDLNRTQFLDKIFLKAKEQVSNKLDLSENYYLEKAAAENGIEEKKFQKLDRRAPAILGAIWLEKMADTSSSALLEKMTLFWHGHFACRPKKGNYAVNYLNTLRKHALGNFKDLLLAVSRDSAMLRFLNNQQNKKSAPNENFARELLELFTLGQGQYSEKDIKEAARSFTGWSSNQNGEFLFKRRHHDYGEKVFFTTRGNFDGEDIINIILSQKKCAEFIASKIYTFFVSDTPSSEHIHLIADILFDSEYDIKKTMRFLFSSDWFYEEKVIGKKIKSPTELLVAHSKILGLTFNKTKSVIFLEKLLGQVLMVPPNVAGWAGGRSWIDNSTLSVRINLPHYLAKNIPPELSAKGSLKDVKKSYTSKNIDVSSNPKAILEWLDRFRKEDQTKELVGLLTPNNPELEQNQVAQASTLDQVIAILGSLEFQLG